MQKYRFVGTEMQFADSQRKLTKLGQEIQLTVEQRRNLGSKTPLIHSKLFDTVGFTEQELSLYMYAGARINAPEAFVAKLRKAWALIGHEPEAEVETKNAEVKK